MDWRKSLLEKFKDDIMDAKLINEDGLINLDITIKQTDTENLDCLNLAINEYIDQFEKDINFDCVVIHSPGFDTNYAIDELANHIGETIDIKLKKSVNKQDFYIGKLLEANETSIKIKWNCKGQFRDIEIPLDAISKVSLHIDF
ncbi:ribosome assembly cofactor RimP [Mycoplasmopsis adleri]|uniref:ribosome assembly cofactor RimP n=1 Tax=Mycoplasmopsis adleri TaxID=51362 RepID=UPI0038735DA8